jgi:hypothetical protein
MLNNTFNENYLFKFSSIKHSYVTTICECKNQTLIII